MPIRIPSQIAVDCKSVHFIWNDKVMDFIDHKVTTEHHSFKVSYIMVTLGVWESSSCVLICLLFTMKLCVCECVELCLNAELKSKKHTVITAHKT